MISDEILTTFWFRLQAYMQAGGIVMWPLAGLSLVMWLLILERLVFIGRMYRQPMSLEEVRDHVVHKQEVGNDTYGGAVAQLIRNFLAVRSGEPVLDARILGELVRTLNRSLTDRLTLIGVLAAVAPLLGLLGTVTGMITTFDVLSFFGTGNTKAMAGGISEALVTTQTGLLVAIPGLYMKSFLDRRAGNLTKHITATGLYLQRQL